MTGEGLLRLDGSCLESAPPIFDPESRRFTRLDALWLTIWLIFLGGLAALPPQLEWHKQLILLAIGIVQLLEAKVISRFPKRGVFYVMLLKITLATLLLDHTAERRHQQQLLADLLRPGGDGRALLWALGDDVVDAVCLGRLLLLSLPGAAGIRVDARRRWAYSVCV